MNTTHLFRLNVLNFRMLAGLFGTLGSLLVAIAATNLHAATLPNQYRNLPEIKHKPEPSPGSGVGMQPIAGGSSWSDSAQTPVYVPVQFWVFFKAANCTVSATLAGSTVSTNDTWTESDSGNIFIDTPTNQVNLKVNQTYKFTMAGTDVYDAQINIQPPTLNDLFSSATTAQQPARLYSAWFFNPSTGTWQKLCPSTPSQWNVDTWGPMNATFLVQVRPDLGARPVTRPGLHKINGGDQADDAWTREEPSIDATTAPGDADALKISSAKMGDPSFVSFDWAVAMGRIWTGSGAGHIHIDETNLNASVYTPSILNYWPSSDDTNEVAVKMDLDNTNWICQVKAPQALATADPLYGSALFTTNDFISTQPLVQILTNHTDQVSQFLWTNFTTVGQQTLVTNSTISVLQATLVQQINPVLQGPSIYNSTRFAGVALSGHTRRLLLLNPTGADLIRLNRFLLEDAYPGTIARLASTVFALNFYAPSQVGVLDSLGFFSLNSGASPFVTWYVGLPAGTTNQWQLQEARNGATNTSLLQWAPATGVWTLTRGSGNDSRVETRTIVTNTVSGTKYSTETQVVKNGAGTISDQTVEVYQSFAWGYELVSVTNDPSGAQLVTQFTFGTDTNDPPSYGHITSITYPDGYWERHIYSSYDPVYYWNAPYGSLIQIIAPWENSPITSDANSCWVSDYAYPSEYLPGTYQVLKWHDANSVGEGTTEPNNYDPNMGRSRSATYSDETFVRQDPCASSILDETRQLGNLFHYGEYQCTTSLGPTYGDLYGQLRSKDELNGRFDSYDYEYGQWNSSTRTFAPTSGGSYSNDVRQTIFHGVDSPVSFVYDQITIGPSGNPIEPVDVEPYRATKEIRIISGGNLVAKELYVYQGNVTTFALINQVVYQRDSLGHATQVTRYDPGTGQGRVIYQADWQGGATWPADLKLSDTDEHGTAYTYSYDTLKRVKTRTKQPATGQTAIVQTFSYDAANRVLTNTTSAGSLSLSTVSLYDVAGRLATNISPEALKTVYTYQNGGQQTTITTSSGTTKIISNYLDRRIASITGTAVTNQFFDYSLVGSGTADFLWPQNVTKVTLGASNSLRWSATVTDQREVYTADEKPAFGNTNTIWRTLNFNPAVSLNPGVIYQPGLVADSYYFSDNSFETFCKYDGYGQPTIQGSNSPDEPNSTCNFTPASNERITTFTNYYYYDSGSGHWFRNSEQWTYPFSQNGTPYLVKKTMEQLTGLYSTNVSEVDSFDADTNETTVRVTVDLANKKTTTTTTAAQSVLSAVQVVVNGLLQTESTETVSQATSHYYDALGREIGAIDPLGNLSGTQYDANTGQVTATTNAQLQVTTMSYYAPGGTNAGLLYCTTGPTGKKTCYNYDGCGRIIQIWGDVPYPEQRGYNSYGDQVTLTTYRGGTQWTGPSWPSNTGPTADVTTWNYDSATGLLTNKTDAAGQAVKYDYYDNGMQKTLIWARGVARTNLYTANGDLVSMAYSDDTSVFFTNSSYLYLNRLTKPDVIIDASGSNNVTYDYAGRTLSTTCTGGLMSGITVSNHFNTVYGRDSLMVSGTSPPLTNQFTYDSYGRLSTVACGIYSATYGYLPNSDLLQTTTDKSNSLAILTTTRTWQTGQRLQSIVNSANGNVVTSHTYAYDALDRRKSALLEDGSHWEYDYDDRNELTRARREWSDWAPASGQQFAYSNDNIGNRIASSSGGDTNGANLRPINYAVNSLDQYTTVTNLGYRDILGIALATNTVNVTNTLTAVGGLADRKNEYFHRELPINNTNAPLWQPLSVSSGGSVSNGGFAFPAYTQTNTYDTDGNLTSDGIWVYQWDIENRLVTMSMTNISGLTAPSSSNRLRLDFVYDYMGRRMQKMVSCWTNSAFVAQSTNRFVYDGWNQIAVINPQNSVDQAFLRGQDLSGTTDGAGGIGGLAAVLETVGGQVSNSHFACYDGNGNVTGLVKTSDLSASARYEYSPFGELLRATGPMARSNPFRFSTKFTDDETGLDYYGHRYHNPTLGRWISRDPIAEDGGDNLYAFVQNNSLSRIDPIGHLGLLDVLITDNGESAGRVIQVQRGNSLVQQVRGIENSLNNLEQFEAGVDAASGIDITDMLEDIARAKSAIAQGFRGVRSAERAAEDLNHIFPKAKMFREFFARNNVNFRGVLMKMDSVMHQYGIHTPGTGGQYNRIWRDFMNNNKTTKNNPYFVIGFGFGLMDKLAPYLEL